MDSLFKARKLVSRTDPKALAKEEKEIEKLRK
jgi:hypothetical protein